MKKQYTKRQLNAIQTKKRLFDSAMTLFKEKGFSAVSVDEIAAKAGTSKGSFYTYFTTKEQVITEQFRKLDDHYIKVQEQLSNEDTFLDKLLFFFQEQQRYVLEILGVELLKVAYYSQIRDEHEAAAMLNENRIIYKVIHQLVVEAQQRGELRTDFSPETLVQIIVRTMRGSYYDFCLHDGNYDLIAENKQYFRLLIEGFLQK